MRSGLPDVLKVSTSIRRLTARSSAGVHISNRSRNSRSVSTSPPVETECLRLPRDLRGFVNNDWTAGGKGASCDPPQFFDNHLRQCEVDGDFFLPFARDVREDEVFIYFFPSEAAPFLRDFQANPGAVILGRVIGFTPESHNPRPIKVV